MFYFFKGRVALYAILKAIGINPGDEIIVPGFTCIVVPNAIKYLCARPVYVDIDSETFNIDTDKIEGKISNKTKAILAQHTFGMPAEMDRINEIARKYKLFVIEDSCHSIGSMYKGSRVGSLGDGAFFSSQWSKPITTGLGGWAVINNEDLTQKMKRVYASFKRPSLNDQVLLMAEYFTYVALYRSSLFWGLQKAYRYMSKKGIAIGSSSNTELEGDMPLNYERKMSRWQRDLLDKKMRGIEKDINKRKHIASLYEMALKKKGIKPLNIPDEIAPVLLRYPVLVKDKMKTLAEAKSKRIEIGDWFTSPVHPNTDSWETAGYSRGSCPVAEKISRHIVNLPTHQKLSNEDTENIIEFILQADLI